MCSLNDSSPTSPVGLILFNEIEQLNSLWMKYARTPRDYGTGIKIGMAEVHMLSRICAEPGITPTELARESWRTTGAVSQILDRLEKRGYIQRTKYGDSDKTVHLYTTKSGNYLSSLHNEFDASRLSRTMNRLLSKYTLEEIEVAGKILHEVNAITLDIFAQQENL